MVEYDSKRDVQVCSNCGDLCESQYEKVECWNCGGDGEFDGFEEDPLWYDDGDTYSCHICEGRGSWLVCLRCEAETEKPEGV